MEKIAQDSYKLYINGQWIDASDGATFQTRCPTARVWPPAPRPPERTWIRP